MSDPHSETAAAEEVGPPPAAPSPAAPSPAAPPLEEPKLTPPPLPDRRIAFGLAGVLVGVIVLAATAPFWAPALPWATAPARDDTALMQRLNRLDASQQRIDRLETAQKSAEQQIQQAVQQQGAAANATLQPLERRIAALEAKPAVVPSDIDDIRRQLAKFSAATGDLVSRLDALDKSVHAQVASDSTDRALVLALLQIRDAVQAGRPFVAEYEALTALARARPDITEAAAPLAEPARTGVAGRAVLATRLHALAGTIATAQAPPPASTRGDWTDAALNKLSGLVTVRRIDGGGTGSQESGPEAQVHAAELALAGGDLEGAVAVLDKLSDAPAEAAAPWQRMARQRLAVEAALRRVEAALVARLGKEAVPAAPAVSGSPG